MSCETCKANEAFFPHKRRADEAKWKRELLLSKCGFNYGRSFSCFRREYVCCSVAGANYAGQENNVGGYILIRASFFFPGGLSG